MSLPTLDAVRQFLRSNGFSNVAVSDDRDVPALLDAPPADLLLLGVPMPHVNGIDLLKQVRQVWPATEIVLVTAHNDARTAVECVKAGAFDYLVKPIDQARLVTTVTRALEARSGRADAQRAVRPSPGDPLRHPDLFAGIVTRDEGMRAIFHYVESIAPTGLPILITGETGVGKELIARAVHAVSGRRGPFVSVNAAGIDDTLFSDALFGHVTGAFTGADRNRRGLIDKAAHGTLFLDEIGDIRPESQVKLLRLLQEGSYYRLGSEVEEHSTARIVAATNRSVKELASDAAFRKDLFYRLKPHHIRVPSLRERLGDLPLLAATFLAQAASQQHKEIATVGPAFYAILAGYDYPGNIRELQGLIADAVGRHVQGRLCYDSIRAALGQAGPAAEQGAPADSAGAVTFAGDLPTLAQADLALIHEALRRCHGNKKRAAEMLGVTRQTLRARLAKDTSHSLD